MIQVPLRPGTMVLLHMQIRGRYQVLRIGSERITLNRGFPKKTGAGEGIRTLDPNLGKVVLYP
jgi:hypothetical protein